LPELRNFSLKSKNWHTTCDYKNRTVLSERTEI